MQQDGSVEPILFVVHLCRCVWMCVHEHSHGICVEVRVQPSRIGSPLSLIGYWQLNPGCRAWQPAPLPAEPCHMPQSYFKRDTYSGESPKPSFTTEIFASLANSVPTTLATSQLRIYPRPPLPAPCASYFLTQNVLPCNSNVLSSHFSHTSAL